VSDTVVMAVQNYSVPSIRAETMIGETKQSGAFPKYRPAPFLRHRVTVDKSHSLPGVGCPWNKIIGYV
jgi:hypothetical protein